ncbi:hypothetical protein PV10_06394 [Exophiala mesophila]|uniref:Uncharacterized protein n=1 Tax=Exophiala mesophila TaxID=212818 RepID=A0A0D1ZD94_EXOME|nr:uncharacterized protein PV10_06394 [Exophiala mesophila]KIV91904.1 hypothetical protein PV10_06394 [Exophiala mesophila]
MPPRRLGEFTTSLLSTRRAGGSYNGDFFSTGIQQNLFGFAGKVHRERLDWAFHKLGSPYADQGKLVEAEKMYTRALYGYEEALGLKHTSTLDTASNLGILYAERNLGAECDSFGLAVIRLKCVFALSIEVPRVVLTLRLDA